MGRKVALAAMFLAGVAVVVGMVVLSSRDSGRLSMQSAYAVPGEPGMTVEVASNLSDKLMPALLLVVYDAFGRTQEDEIYDTLASVTDGDALEYLYLERVGAMAGGGLEEADQTIHEIFLLESQVDRDGSVLSIDASWQVIGTVGHAEHLHVRGNTYSAQLTVAPVDDAWKITEFDLLDVNRDGAGETFLAPETD